MMWLDVAARQLTDGPDAEVYVSARDVSDDVLAMHHLSAAEQQWRVAFENSPIGGALLASDGSIVLTNDALVAMLGHPRHDFVHLNILDVFGGESGLGGDARWREFTYGRSVHYAGDIRCTTLDGHTVWCRLTAAAVPASDTSSRRLMLQVQDITDRRDAELQLADRALHDSLTSLPNRFFTRQWLTSALEEHAGQPVGVLYFDVDRFKLINDSLGHAAGDELLGQLAARVRQALRPDDFVGRVGGDEFVVIAEGVAAEGDLLHLAARLTASMEDPFILAGHQHVVTLSLGGAIGVHPEPADHLLVRADMALLRAKRLGRSRCELFDDAVDKIATAVDLQLEDELRQSVAANELRVHYQPIVRLDDLSVAGYESLLRWQHPEQGLLPPDRFLDMAEVSGLIRPIGWWVLSRACRDAKEFATGWAPGPWVSVNASPSQLARPGVASMVRRALTTSGLAPQLLHLEVTETVLMHASPALIRELHEVSAMGVGIALDDFGTGYSSLSLLRQFPVNTVKIDQSFVAPLSTDRSALAIVRAVVGMCQDLGLTSVAEGIETEEQLAVLTDLGCTHGQGFLFGRPAALPDALRASA
jgi:diguanylate cyclase (GGDEF)-like protein/PAS domain S-box-containing protein